MLFVFQVGEQGVLIGAIDFNLGKHIKFDSLVLSKLLDILVASWLLPAKLVAGKSQDPEATTVTTAVGREFVIHLYQLAVVDGGLASLGGYIDHYAHMTLVILWQEQPSLITV